MNAEEREALRVAIHAELTEQGLGQGNSLHSWRCDHPDRYGACTCLDEVVTDLLAGPLAALLDAADRADAEAARAEAAQAKVASVSAPCQQCGHDASEHWPKGSYSGSACSVCITPPVLYSRDPNRSDQPAPGICCRRADAIRDLGGPTEDGEGER